MLERTFIGETNKLVGIQYDCIKVLIITFLFVVMTFANQIHANPNNQTIFKQDIVLVAIGGWGSCTKSKSPQNQFMAGQMRNLKMNLLSTNAHIRIHLLNICSPHLLKSSFGNRGMDYSFHNHSTNQFNVGRTAESSVVFLLKNIKAQLPNSIFFIMGHSHGGATAMRAIYQMAHSGLNFVKGLFTIEPIDSASCNTRAWLRNEKRRQLPDCRRAPNWPLNELSVIRSTASNNWHNYTFVHRSNIDNGQTYSGRIAGNYAFEHSLTSHYGKDTHHMIGAHHATWTHIYGVVSRSLGIQGRGFQPLFVDKDGLRHNRPFTTNEKTTKRRGLFRRFRRR